MKMTDLKREHFPNGHTFSQKLLDDYLAAQQQARRDFFTHYILSIGVGMAAGFVLLVALPEGMLRVFLAMLCVMLGGLYGTKRTTASLERLKEMSRKVMLTRKDIRTAKKHLKNGTVAWTEEKEKITE